MLKSRWNVEKPILDRVTRENARLKIDNNKLREQFNKMQKEIYDNKRYVSSM